MPFEVGDIFEENGHNFEIIQSYGLGVAFIGPEEIRASRKKPVELMTFDGETLELDDDSLFITDLKFLRWRNYTFKISTNRFKVPKGDTPADITCAAWLVNHSTQPNCIANGKSLKAIKRIEPGDELTFNYGKTERDWMKNLGFEYERFHMQQRMWETYAACCTWYSDETRLDDIVLEMEEWEALEPKIINIQRGKRIKPLGKKKVSECRTRVFLVTYELSDNTTVDRSEFAAGLNKPGQLDNFPRFKRCIGAADAKVRPSK